MLTGKDCIILLAEDVVNHSRERVRERDRSHGREKGQQRKRWASDRQWRQDNGEKSS